MDINEVKSFMETNKDNEDVKGFLNSFKVEPTLEVFKEKFNNDTNFKSFLDSEKDKHSSKSLETWKANNLDSLINTKIKELYPDADPKDLKYKELEDRFNNAEKARFKEQEINKALKVAQEKKLPTDLITFFIGSDSDATDKNLEKLITTMAAHDEAIKLEFTKSNSYTPPADKGNVSDADKLRSEVAKYMK